LRAEFWTEFFIIWFLNDAVSIIEVIHHQMEYENNQQL